MTMVSIRRLTIMVVLPFIFDVAVAGVLTLAEQSSPARFVRVAGR